MSGPYVFGYKHPANGDLQRALAEHHFYAGAIDDIYGSGTRDAVAALQTNLGIVATGKPDAAVLNYLGLAPAEKPNLLDLLNLLPLLKGKTMTSDQIGGLVRWLLSLIGGALVAKGIIAPDVWTWIASGILTLVPVVWSWISNRPKVIAPLGGQK